MLKDHGRVLPGLKGDLVDILSLGNSVGNEAMAQGVAFPLDTRRGLVRTLERQHVPDRQLSTV